MFDLITQSMLFLLEALKSVVGSYGWAIVALTVLVRIVLWPVSRSQMRSMKMMQEIQPKMKQVQERYKSDPQRLQAEMFKLYKEHKFNPLGGCLPMLIQLPIFLGLFWAVSSPQLLTTGDPTFLNFIHLKHTGIVSHGGASNDDQMSLTEGGGGFLGAGKDHIIAGQEIKVVLENGKILTQKIPNANKALTVLPKKPQPGIPLKISTDFAKLGLEGYEGYVQTVDLMIINSGTQERESVVLMPKSPKDTQLQATLDTVQGKTVMNLDVLILVIIFAVTMIWSQKMMSAQSAPTANEQQQQMMKFLPLIFTVFLFIFPIPAGVLLYMDTNSVFQIIQTWAFQREHKSDSGKLNPPSQAILDIKPEGPNA